MAHFPFSAYIWLVKLMLIILLVCICTCTYGAGDGSISAAAGASSSTMSVLDFVSQPMILDRLLESRKQFDAILKGLH